MAYFVPDEPADKYIERKVEGGLSKTFGAMLPGYSSPTGALAMRDGVEGDELVETFAGMFLPGAKLSGFRSGEKSVDVLLVGEGGQMIIAFDPATKLQIGMNATLTPPGMPPTMQISLDMKVENKVADQLDTPIVFEKGSRTAAADVMELMGAAGEPPMKIKVGDPAPAGVLATLDGGSFDIGKDGKGKVVVIDFWATWCAPCRKGLPLLDKFATEMKSNDRVAVFAVNVWEEEEGPARIEKVKSFWTGQKLGVETLIDGDSSFIEAFGFSGIPAFVVIGPDGTVAALHVGYDPNLVETLAAK
jgi:thiol-disulfide isomerase/thioredoxin